MQKSFEQSGEIEFDHTVEMRDIDRMEVFVEEEKQDLRYEGRLLERCEAEDLNSVERLRVMNRIQQECALRGVKCSADFSAVILDICEEFNIKSSDSDFSVEETVKFENVPFSLPEAQVLDVVGECTDYGKLMFRVFVFKNSIQCYSLTCDNFGILITK